MATVGLCHEGASGQLLGPGLTALEENPALLELQSDCYPSSCGWDKEIFNLRQEEKAPLFSIKT